MHILIANILKPVLTKSPTGIGQIANRYWPNHNRYWWNCIPRKRVGDLANTSWWFGQYQLAIWPIAVLISLCQHICISLFLHLVYYSLSQSICISLFHHLSFLEPVYKHITQCSLTSCIVFWGSLYASYCSFTLCIVPWASRSRGVPWRANSGSRSSPPAAGWCMHTCNKLFHLVQESLSFHICYCTTKVDGKDYLLLPTRSLLSSTLFSTKVKLTQYTASCVSVTCPEILGLWCHPHESDQRLWCPCTCCSPQGALKIRNFAHQKNMKILCI